MEQHGITFDTILKISEVKMNINRHLFAAYCGMIKSGYDLMDLSDEIVINVCNWISNVDFDKKILEYFRYTKTNKIQVNPYYPRGSDLSAACFFQDKSIAEYIEFLRLCESPEADNPQFIAWVTMLPSILEQIENYDTFDNVYHYYCEAIEQRFADVPKQMTDIEKIVMSKPFSTQTSIEFAPNLLQFKYLADYALAGDTLYVISGVFKNSAVIHEYLHLALKPIRGTLLNIVQSHPLSWYVNMEKMLELGYLRGNCIEDLAHTLDECLVRALCGVIDKTLDVNEYCRENVQSGFDSVPQMIYRLNGFPWSDMSLKEIVLYIMNVTK